MKYAFQKNQENTAKAYGRNLSISFNTDDAKMMNFLINKYIDKYENLIE